MGKRFIIYGSLECEFCIMAMDFLSASNIEFDFLEVESDDFLSELKKFYDMKTIPIILSNDLETGLIKKIGGYTDLLQHLS